MHKLVLLRHGESVWNKENRFSGWADVDLTVSVDIGGKTRDLKITPSNFDVLQVVDIPADAAASVNADSSRRAAPTRRACGPVSVSSAHSGSAGGPMCPQPRGQSPIASARSAKAISTSSGWMGASPNERIPGVSTTQPPPGSGASVAMPSPVPGPSTIPDAVAALRELRGFDHLSEARAGTGVSAQIRPMLGGNLRFSAGVPVTTTVPGATVVAAAGPTAITSCRRRSNSSISGIPSAFTSAHPGSSSGSAPTRATRRSSG